MLEHPQKSGFQGSENSGAEVIFYPQGGDPIVVNTQTLAFEGRSNRDRSPSLVSVETTKTLGAPSGSWNIAFKPGRNDVAETVFNQLIDDDWVDISFTRHGRKWHVMRGLVGNIRRLRNVAGSGATSTTYTISGQDFGRIWEKTPVWFNPYADENLGGAVSSKVFGGAENVLGPPSKAVTGFLRGFLEELGGLGRANWVMPKNMPNVTEKFIDSVIITTGEYTNDPPLIGLSQNYLMPQGTLWSLAKEWSDPLFNELFVDTKPNFLVPDVSAGVSVDQTEMQVRFRDRPFPTLALRLGSAYFKLPLHIVPYTSGVTVDVGRSGDERYNAFFVAPQLTQEVLGAYAIDVLQPEWHSGDIEKHGLRRFDVMSKYTSPDADLATMSSAQRIKVRDWYMMNPYLLSGSVSLGMGRPEIQIGERIRIPGPQSEREDETYYVEQATNSWRFGAGVRTSLGVTRGWVGTDNSYLEAMESIAAGYESAKRATPADARFEAVV